VFNPAQFESEYGEGLFNQNAVGLAAGSYQVRLMGARSSSANNPTIYVASGTAAIIVR
jgi:hypothetical protein